MFSEVSIKFITPSLVKAGLKPVSVPFGDG